MKRSTRRLFFVFLVTILSSNQCNGMEPRKYPYEKPDFFTSMGWYKKSNEYYKQRTFLGNSPAAQKELFHLHKLKLLYDKNMIVGTSIYRKPVIPKIVHQIWLGPKKPPAVFRESQKSIQELHPDWGYKLWTDADIPRLQLHNQQYYDRMQNFGGKADIVRYELLYRFGGLYLDIDFVCKKPLDWLCHYDLWAVTLPLDC